MLQFFVEQLKNSCHLWSVTQKYLGNTAVECKVAIVTNAEDADYSS